MTTRTPPAPTFRVSVRAGTPTVTLPLPIDLDPHQAAAVAARGAVVRILGAPGTGKTTVAVHAVLDRVGRGEVPADACIVLAPTRRAAARLREGLTARLGATTTEPLVRTHQALGYGILRAAAARRGDPPPRLLSGPEQDVVLRELLAGHAAGAGRVPSWPADLEAAVGTRGFRAELRDLLMRAVEHGLEPDDLRRLGAAHDEPAWAAAAEVLAEYDEVTALANPGAYDPAWILTAAADTLADDPEALRITRARARVIVVDDAQELTAAGARLLRVLAGPGTDVVLVGDPDAATQTFRGADPRLMLGSLAQGDEQDAPPLVLRRGWRLPAELAAVSGRVTEHVGALAGVGHRRPEPRPVDARGGTRARAGGDGEGSGGEDEGAVGDAVAGAEAGRVAGAQVDVAVVTSAAQEAQLVAARLRRAHLLRGVPWSQMAVLVRGAARTATLRRVLAAQGVPVDVPGAHLPLGEQPAVRPFVALLGACLDLARGQACPISVETAHDVLTSPLGGADAVTLRRLRRALRRADAGRGGAPRTGDELVVAALLGDPILDALGEEGAHVRRVAAVIAAGVTACRGGGSPDAPPGEGPGADGRTPAEGTRAAVPWPVGVTAETVLWAMWSATGLADPWRRTALAGGVAGARADADLDAVVGLMDAAARYVDRLPLRGPDGFLDHLRAQEVVGDSLVARAPSDDAVTLTTPQGAAGLEWELVVVAGVQDGVWPDLRIRGSVLGSGRLVDVVTGRDTTPAGARRSVRHDEARLFLAAVSRARCDLLVTAVRDEEEAPSPFLDLVDPRPDAGEDPRTPAPVPTPMSLPGAVATLRREVVLGADESARRTAAARLALLSAQGVAGADPAGWWALRRTSDDRPRRPASTPVGVSPSSVQQFAECELRWLLSAAGGQWRRPGSASAIGTLVHDIAATVDNADVPAMTAELDRRWGELGLRPGWLSDAARTQAERMLAHLARYDVAARAAGWEVAGRELDVATPLGRAVVRGRVDRLERDPQGRLRVVDLKTGSSKPSAAEVERHAQLGAYQVAVAEGAFGDAGRGSAGAALVQLGKAAGAGGSVQEQRPLTEDDDPTWARRLLDRTAEGMAGQRVQARAGAWCRMCSSRPACPVQPDGEHLR